MNHTRVIFKSATSAPYAARDALTAVLAEEMVVPSDVVYLLAPWVSNIVIFDNRIGAFDGLNAEWGRREVRPIEVLVAIAQNNTRLAVRVKPDPHNQPFCQRLIDALKEAGVADKCQLTQSAALHTKGLATSRALISGSMNFTATGISISDESLLVSFDPQAVAAARIEFARYDEN